MDKENILLNKAHDAQIVYDYLSDLFKIETKIPVTFIADKNTEKILKRNYLKENPFPHVIKFVLAGLRKKAVNKIFEEEKITQSPVIAAVLSLCAELATEIGELRGDSIDHDEIYTDISFAGLQAIRLYMANYTDKKFKKSRLQSAIRVDNAFNGSFYKYKTLDNRYISIHTYYQSQQEKLVKELNLKKASNKFTLTSTKKDRKYLQDVIGDLDSFALEDRAFKCGACACVIRDRDEFLESPVGQAVKGMPLIKFKTDYGKKKLDFGEDLDRGPLTGVRVLDLTHIIAGPACTRILAEYGADVLLVRRGKFKEQEQAMLELDGWEGKDSIQLDLNKEEDLSYIKTLIKQAHVIVYSYQYTAFDKFGLSLEEIRNINPNVIYANLNCFSDTEWQNRPGWAPLAEDITGLSVRNGTKDNPVNLNGVPLDYIPGFILAMGVLMAIRDNIKDKTICDVTTSLCRGALLLHEATDLCKKNPQVSDKTKVTTKALSNAFKNSRVYVETKAIGTVGFPSPATYHTKYRHPEINMGFCDGKNGFKTLKTK